MENAQRRAWEREYTIADTETVRIDVAAHRADVSSYETQPLRAVTRPLPALQQDEQGRFYLLAFDGQASTAALVERQVLAFVSQYGHYPETILLSPLRFLASCSRMSHYSLPHFGVFIPIVFERATYERLQFDVMVRG